VFALHTDHVYRCGGALLLLLLLLSLLWSVSLLPLHANQCTVTSTSPRTAPTHAGRGTCRFRTRTSTSQVRAFFFLLCPSSFFFVLLPSSFVILLSSIFLLSSFFILHPSSFILLSFFILPSSFFLLHAFPLPCFFAVLSNFSQLWALYCLLKFFYACRDELAPWRPVGKFLCVKSVVFFTWWQVRQHFGVA
jgi:hypothetical protein